MASDHPDVGRVAVLGQGTRAHRLARLAGGRFGTRYVTACGASSYLPRLIARDAPSCLRCLNKESGVQEFPTCAVCGETDVEDAGDHTDRTGHRPIATGSGDHDGE